MNGISGIPSAFQSAVSALQRSQNALNRDAAVIAQPSVGISPEMIGALIDSRQQVLYTQAAAKLISAADQATQSLIDIHA